VPKDKAVARFQMRNIVDGSSKRDIKDNYAYDESSFTLPKIYVKNYYCISSAIHLKIVRARSAVRGDRNTRYTTKLRRFVEDEAKTGGFAVPAPNFIKQSRPNNQGSN
jgi:small subunit ribosomal protein S26e